MIIVESEVYKTRRRWFAVILAVVLIFALAVSAFVLVTLHRYSPLPHEMVCQLTGEDALNDTSVVNVYGTDLGFMVIFQDRLNFIFGDTFGPDGWDWRSNTMAYTTDMDPSDGIILGGWVTDDVTHFAKELIHSAKIDGVEKTVIPTAAYATDDCLYVFYMSVNTWGEHGDWICNNASIAYSTDGQTFIEALNVSWPGDSNFIEWGLIKSGTGAPTTGGYVYFLATASGRYHSCYLTRIHEDHILNQSSYQYFTGYSITKAPLWSSDHTEAQPVFDAQTGELTAMWNPYLNQYMVMNLDNPVLKIFLRTAQSPWGPWSPPRTVISIPEYFGFYSPNIDPVLVEDNGRIVYFTMSLWTEYNVYLMKVDLTQLGGTFRLETLELLALPYPWICGSVLLAEAVEPTRLMLNT